MGLSATLTWSTVGWTQTPPPSPPAEAPPGASSELVKSVAGGLTAEQVGRRAATTSYSAKASQESLQAAAARADTAFANFLPRLSGTARYTRLSDLTPPTLGGGNLVGTSAPGGTVNPGPPKYTNMSTPFAFSFPIFLNNYSLQASIAVPISDYFLRINEGYSAATHARDAAEFDALAAKARASADGKIAFYSWLRARGSTVVATRSLQDQRTHLKDARNQFSVGNASKADVLRAETGEAAAELAVERTANLAELAEAQVRIALHTGQEERLLPGENLEINPVPMAGNMKQLVNEALANRYEVKSLDANLLATRRQTALARASHYPQLVGVGNVTYANPNQRLIPSQDKWFGTWDVTAQLTWSPNDNVSATSQVSEAIARTRALEAQRMALRDGIELEVTQAFLAVREADFALDSTRRQLASAVEALRVAEELFRNGRATATLVADAETDLTMSRLQALNAMVDARVGRVRLEHALGRDVQVLSH